METIPAGARQLETSVVSGARSRMKWVTSVAIALSSPAQPSTPTNMAVIMTPILAVDVFHRQEGVPLELADVVHAAHVRMRYLPRHPHFGVELRQPCRIAIDRFREELQRDRLPEFEIVCAVDLTHPTFAEASDDAVAVVEDGAGFEAAVIDVRGGARPSAAVAERFRAACGGSGSWRRRRRAR